MPEELLEIVDDEGLVIGIAPRSEIHGNPSLIHRVVHVLVFNTEGELLLQRRSMKKDVAPGRWDTSVGGHIDPGEDVLTAAKREMHEELGLRNLIWGSAPGPRYLYSYRHSNPYETELVYTFHCIENGPFTYNEEEIEEVRFWSIGEIRSRMQDGSLSDNFKDEISNYLMHTGGNL